MTRTSKYKMPQLIRNSINKKEKEYYLSILLIPFCAKILIKKGSAVI